MECGPHDAFVQVFYPLQNNHVLLGFFPVLECECKGVAFFARECICHD